MQSATFTTGRYRFRILVQYEEAGSGLVELALILPILLMLLVGTIDFGRAFFAATEVSSAAEAAAWYGIQQPSDIQGMKAAAVLDASDIGDLTATISTGCQCSDGSSVVQGCASAPTGCAASVVNFVQVTTNATYTPILRYPGLPSVFNLQGTARMRSSY